MEHIFAHRLADLRADNRINQTELAKATGLSQAAISRWEKGDRIPDIIAIEKLCHYFGVSSDYLIGLENEDGTKTYRQDANIISTPIPPPVPRPHAVPYAARSGAIGVAHLTDEQARKLDELLGLNPDDPKK